MMKRGGPAIFLLGVSGLSLSIAMFVDNLKKPEFVDEVAEEEETTLDEPVMPPKPAVITRQSNVPIKDYAQVYRDEERAKEVAYWGEFAKDYAYKGDGSKWDKDKYFKKEAYRRARDHHPIPHTLMLAARVDTLADALAEDVDDMVYSSDSTITEESDTEDEDTMQ